MCSHEWMLDIRRLIDFFLSANFRATGRSRRIVSVNRLQTFQVRFPLIRKIFVCLAHIAEPCLTTLIRNDDGLQHRRLRRYLKVRIVGVPTG